MRFINQSKLELEIEDELLEEARSAFEEFEFAEINVKEFSRIERLSSEDELILLTEARKSVIRENAQIWSRFKEILSKQSYGKCWYCESKELRSDNAVDHFRPKNGIFECRDHTGYWWLAFDWRNFRFSCTYCNSKRIFEDSSGGKQNHFPLITPPEWACNPGEEAHEINVLLDPCDCDDVRLLSFDISGRPTPANGDNKSGDYLRANKSIEIYHLDHEATRRARKDLSLEIRDLVNQINRAITAKDRQTIRTQKEKLIRLLQPDSEKSFNSVARVYLRQYRNLEWVQHILDHQ